MHAEVKIANLLVQHNISLLAVTDHLSPVFKDIFPDNDTAKGFASARTKTTCIINGSLAPHYRIAVDGSNDTGLEKMNPMTVRHFDDTQGEVVNFWICV